MDPDEVARVAAEPVTFTMSRMQAELLLTAACRLDEVLPEWAERDLDEATNTLDAALGGHKFVIRSDGPRPR